MGLEAGYNGNIVDPSLVTQRYAISSDDLESHVRLPVGAWIPDRKLRQFRKTLMWKG